MIATERRPSFRLVIPGEPRGQGRPRIGRGAGGRPRAFTDAKTRAYAELIQVEWIAAGRPTLIDGPYGFRVDAVYTRPAGHYRRDGSLSAAGKRALVPGKPDLDNVVKGALDALVAVGAIPDDRHLGMLDATKGWADDAWWLDPGVVIEARCWDVVAGEARGA